MLCLRIFYVTSTMVTVISFTYSHVANLKARKNDRFDISQGFLSYAHGFSFKVFAETVSALERSVYARPFSWSHSV